MKIYIATFDNEFGIATWAFKSYESAQAKKDLIAREWWAHEFPDAEMPEENVGDAYFELMTEHSGYNESFLITECELKD